MKTFKKPIISIIAILAKDRGIGKDNKLLFNIPEDLKYFRKITLNHTVIMGYNTYKSLGNKALPSRRNIVLSYNNIELSDAEVCKSINEALKLTENDGEIFFIGGASIYHQAIKIADKLYLTEVDAIKPADTYFPDYSDFPKRKKVKASSDKHYQYIFYEYERK